MVHGCVCKYSVRAWMCWPARFSSYLMPLQCLPSLTEGRLQKRLQKPCTYVCKQSAACCAAFDLHCLQGRFVDGSPFQAATGKPCDLTKEASDALEAAGFHRLGGACLLMRMPAQVKGAIQISAWINGAMPGRLKGHVALEIVCDVAL